MIKNNLSRNVIKESKWQNKNQDSKWQITEKLKSEKNHTNYFKYLVLLFTWNNDVTNVTDLTSA